MAATKEKKGNTFEKKSRKKNFLKGIGESLDTKHNVKNSLLETGKDLLIGVIGGGLAGAAIGKPSLLVGIGVTGIGHYLDNQPTKLFGLGLMAANGFQDKSLKGTGMDGVKERILAYKDNFEDKLYVKAVIHKKHPEKEINGLDAVQYFNYKQDVSEANAVNGHHENGEKELSYIEGQIAQSGYAHMERHNMNAEDLENANVFDDDDIENESHNHHRNHRQHEVEPETNTSVEAEQGEPYRQSPENIIM